MPVPRIHVNKTSESKYRIKIMNIFDREELSDEMENKTILHCRNSSNRKIIERDKIHKPNIYIHFCIYISTHFL